MADEGAEKAREAMHEEHPLWEVPEKPVLPRPAMQQGQVRNRKEGSRMEKKPACPF